LSVNEITVCAGRQKVSASLRVLFSRSLSGILSLVLWTEAFRLASFSPRRGGRLSGCGGKRGEKAGVWGCSGAGPFKSSSG
jgi:hypothetical protein